jgi:hypothetical protein
MYSIYQTGTQAEPTVYLSCYNLGGRGLEMQITTRGISFVQLLEDIVFMHLVMIKW